MRFLATLLVLFVYTVTHGWNARGHMIVAAIAYQELTEQQQQSITVILITHPEYNRKWKADYEGVKSEVEFGLYLFMRASVWPDNIRSKTPGP